MHFIGNRFPHPFKLITVHFPAKSHVYAVVSHEGKLVQETTNCSHTQCEFLDSFHSGIDSKTNSFDYVSDNQSEGGHIENRVQHSAGTYTGQ